MKKIVKYPVIGNTISMPANAQVLSLDVCENQVCCWAAVDLNDDKVVVRYFALGTGDLIPKHATQYIKSFHIKRGVQGEFMLHIYERWPIQ